MSYGNYNNQNNTSTRVAGGFLVILIFALVSLCLFGAFGGVGLMVKNFVIGMFGLAAFAYSLGGVFVGIAVCVNKRVSAPPIKILQYAVLFTLGILVLHINSSRVMFADTVTFSKYIEACYGGITVGGAISGIALWPLMKAITPAFSLLAVLLLFAGVVLLSFFPYLPREVNTSTRVTKISGNPKKPSLTNFGNGREEIIGDSVVGSDLYLGTVFENGVFKQIKKPSRKDKKKRSFNLLFPNQDSRFEGSDSLVEPVFDNKRVSARPSDRFMRNDGEQKRKEEFPKPSPFEPFNNQKQDDSGRDAYKSAGNSLLPFSLFDNPSNSLEESSTQPSVLDKKIDMHRPEEEKIKDFQKRFDYLFGTEVSAEDISGSGLKNKAKFKDTSEAHIIEESPADLPPTKEELIENFKKKNSKRLPDSIQRILDGETMGRTVMPPKTFDGREGGDLNADVKNKKNIFIESYDDADLDFRPQNARQTEPTILSSGGLRDYVSGNENYSQTPKEISDAVMPTLAQRKEEEKNQSARTQELKQSPRENKGKTDIDTDFLSSKKVSITPAKPLPLQPKLKDSPQISINEKLEEMKALPYCAPPVTLLNDYEEKTAPEDFQPKIEILERTLASFSITAKVENITQGPTFSRFELRLASGIKVEKVKGLESNIAMSLSAESVRIQAPIPGKDVIGIEIPNKHRSVVSLKSVVSSPQFNLAKSPLTFCLGKDITNSAIVADIEPMPHLLIAGTTGSGKSVCINALLVSLLYKASPEDVKLILIDPKRVELGVFNGLPHMLVKEVLDTPEKASNALSWAIQEMERRYDIFAGLLVKNITDYNELAAERDDLKKMPRILLVIDELADLINSNKRDFESKIAKLTRISRAAGIHLVVATQRPTVDCVTGSIKTNLGARIAFTVRSNVDSRTILDDGGAELLLGKGDMLFTTKEAPLPHRMQGAFISGAEVVSVVNYVKANNNSRFDDDIERTITYVKPDEDEEELLSADVTDASGEDKLFREVLRYSVEEQYVSVSKIQRRFRLGFNRAAGIMDVMNNMGYIEPATGGNKARKVLMTEDDYKQIYGEDEI